MFSGIVEESATVVAVEKEKENMHFTLKCSFVDELKIDQSVAHNGVCLTVVKIENGTYTEGNARPLQPWPAQARRRGQCREKHDDERTSRRTHRSGPCGRNCHMRFS